MDERLVKRWEILTKILSGAAEDLHATDYFAECMHFIEHNEFELALNVLEAAGRKLQLGHDYWHALKKSAEIMDLSERVTELKRLRYQARVAAQQVAPADGFAAR